MVIKRSEREYDLYMRVDANTRGHHQWFFFKVQNQSPIPHKIKFNIVNFTKANSLYQQGMRVYTESEVEPVSIKKKCSNYVYKYSKINKPILKDPPKKVKKYYQLTFEYEFTNENDTTSFAYTKPYTYSHITKLLNDI